LKVNYELKIINVLRQFMPKAFLWNNLSTVKKSTV